MRFYRRLALLTALLLLVIGSLPVAAQTSVTLVVWDNWTRDAEQSLINQLDQQFETAHPGVTIQRQTYSSANFETMLENAQTQGNSPDVAMIGQHTLSAMVQTGLLLPLDETADKYGWWSRYSQELQARNSIDGKLYGISVTAEMVAMFYNKAIFSQLNLTVPLTWDDLEADLLSIKGAGLTPISFGNADGSAGVDTFGALAHAYADIQDINGLVNRSPGAAFLTEGNLEAAQNFSDWLDKGYFSPNFATLDNADALAEFTSGKSALWLAGSDNSSAIIASLTDQAGFFLLPSPIGDSVTPTVGGLGFAYGIRASSHNADLAAQYIDFMTNSDTASALLTIGILPATIVDPSTVQSGTLIADLVNAWATINAAGKVGQHFDAVLPDIGSQIQALAAHKLDPEAFVNALEQDYEAGS